MRESSTYRAILAEGKVECAQEILLDLGTVRFGEPDEATRTALLAINHLGHLKAMSRRVLTTSSWEDLLATPRPQRRRRNAN